MCVALFSIMAERTKHIHAQRSFHLLKERHKTIVKRLVGETTKITRGTFIHSYIVRLSKSPFFFSWLAARPHRSSLRLPYRTYERSTCSKSTTQYTKGYRLSFAQAITRNTASYPNPSLPNSKNLIWDDKQMVEYFSSQFFKRQVASYGQF